MQKAQVRLGLVMLNTLKLSFVGLIVGAASLLIKNMLDLAGVDEIVDLIAGLTPVALAGPLFLDVVGGLAKVPGVREVLGVWSSFVLGPFVGSGHLVWNSVFLWFGVKQMSAVGSFPKTWIKKLGRGPAYIRR